MPPGRRLAQLGVRRGDDKPPALRHGVTGVRRQVQHDLPDLRRVGLHLAEVRGRLGDELDVRPDEPLHHRPHVPDDGVQVQHARDEHLLAAERHDLLRQGGGTLAGVVDVAARNHGGWLQTGSDYFARGTRAEGLALDDPLPVAGAVAFALRSLGTRRRAASPR